MEKQAILQIESSKIKLTIIETKDNLYYNKVDSFTESINLGDNIYSSGLISSATNKEISNILALYRKICDNNKITQVYAFAGNFFKAAKNYKSFIEEMFNSSGFTINVLTEEEEQKIIFFTMLNNTDVSKGVYLYVGEYQTLLVVFNRRNILNLQTFAFGSSSIAKRFVNENPASEIYDNISNFVKESFSKIDVANLVGQEYQFVIGGPAAVSTATLAIKATHYPLEKENNFVLTKEIFDNCFNVVKGIEFDKTKLIKGITNISADAFECGLIILKEFIENSKVGQVTISNQDLLEGYIYTALLPIIADRALSEILSYNLENIDTFKGIEGSNNKKVYALSILLFKQLKVVHKLSRCYVKPLRIASFLYDCGKRIDIDEYTKNCFDVILNSKVNTVSHKDILLAAFICKLQDPNNFVLTDWVKYSSILNDEDLDAVKKLGVIIKLAKALDISKNNVVDDITCDILGDSIIMKTITTKPATHEIREAMKVNGEFKRMFKRFIEVL